MTIYTDNDGFSKGMTWNATKHLLRGATAIALAVVVWLLLGCLDRGANLSLKAIIDPQNIVDLGSFTGGEIRLPDLAAPMGIITINDRPDQVEDVEWGRGFANIYVFPSEAEAAAAFSHLQDNCCPQLDNNTFTMVSSDSRSSGEFYLIRGYWQFEMEMPGWIVPETTPIMVPADMLSYTVVIRECQTVASLFAVDTKAGEQDFVAYAKETQKRIRANLCDER